MKKKYLKKKNKTYKKIICRKLIYFNFKKHINSKKEKKKINIKTEKKQKQKNENFSKP